MTEEQVTLSIYSEFAQVIWDASNVHNDCPNIEYIGMSVAGRVIGSDDDDLSYAEIILREMIAQNLVLEEGQEYKLTQRGKEFLPSS